MDETGTYGHSGQAIYDHEKKEWRFGRSLSSNYSLRPLKESKVAVEATAPPILPLARDGKEGPSRRRENQVKSLVKTYPELQPASTLLPDLARVSEAVEDAAARHDPAKGNLLAFGRIVDETTGSSFEVAAFPSGPTGGNLRIVRVQNQRRGWSDSQSVWLDVPTFQGEEAVWEGPGAPIQSLVFARPLESVDGFLAVRLITQTLVFRPVLCKDSIDGELSLDVNILFNLDIDMTGGLPHADVAFSPWNSQQFGVVDQSGSWSVWQMSSKRAGRGKQICRVVLADENSKSKTNVVDDGWSRIAWIHNAYTVVVCGRQHLMIFDIKLEEPSELRKVDILPESGVGWILDMTILPSRSDCFCVLTSMHIFVYHVGSVQDDEVEVKDLVKIRHFRNEDDISLHLHLFDDGNDVMILIRSNIAPTIINYRLNTSNPDNITIRDPNELSLPLEQTSSEVDSRVCALHVKPLSIHSEQDAASSALGDLYIQEDVRFYTLSTLHRDLSVRQHLYWSIPDSRKSAHVEPPSWEQDLTSHVLETSNDDFIANDDEAGESSGAVAHTEPVSAYVQRRCEQRASRSEDPWTISYELTMRQVNDVDVSEVVGMEEILEEARAILQSGSTGESGSIRTLRDLADGEVTALDIEECSNALQELQSVEPTSVNAEPLGDVDEVAEPTPRLVLRPIDLPPALGFPHLADLPSIQDGIVDTWISSLSDDVPDILRSSREALARRIAAELALASQVIRIEEAKEEHVTQSQSQSQSQSQTWDLPVRHPGAPSSRATPSVYFDASSQPRSPSAAPSAITGSSHPSTFIAPEISHLSRYTTFTAKSTPPPLPRRLRRVLSHWTPGTDPAAYDWRGTYRHLSQRDEDDAEGEEMTEKERRRLQRRTERHVKRQRKEAEESQRLQALSSQAPEIVSASQAAQVTRGNSQTPGLVESSQPQGPAMASQILPGRQGGRPPARKKRKSGF